MAKIKEDVFTETTPIILIDGNGARTMTTLGKYTHTKHKHLVEMYGTTETIDIDDVIDSAIRVLCDELDKSKPLDAMIQGEIEFSKGQFWPE